MIFTVVWLPTAKNQLADICVHALNRQAVTNAADAIDRVLKHDAHHHGYPFLESAHLPFLRWQFSSRFQRTIGW